ncbi:MAG TPA: NmrA family NAD(P)-binding protein [Puia sp.]|uniref:NmrA family NAD(P)-binding protein n=1 Tax=Puia sp. TaxID=2045100 RepID=UPI002B6D6B36|nr:NmrA family NAD(P)-binding protein [Puia sp.]HVU94454.1 NmrA family NAD(P)-binding protein [Puia sp.]
MNTNILVTGATGYTGGSVARNLLEKKIPVRVMVRQLDQRSAALGEMGAEVVKGDLLSLDEVSEAMNGISSAFFVFPNDKPGIVEATAYFAQAAVENGVGHIVNLSQFGAHRHVRSHGAQNHWVAERLLERSGLAVTQLRPTLFAEWFMYQAGVIKTQNRFFLPFGDARFAPIATEDIGRVAASILADPVPHAGKSYDLFGPVILDMKQVAEIFSATLGRTITYVPIDSETFVANVKRAKDAHPYLLQHLASLGRDLQEGRPAGMNDLVERLGGQKPMSMAEYIRKNRSAFE